jgi:uncharacterized protein (UPF0332 family)
MTSPAEIRLYLEKAFETLAQSQANLNLDYYDVAISRAYYAMFYAATALLRSQDVTPKKHSGVHRAFAQHFVQSGLIEPDYSRMLGNAFRLRQDSDYEVTTSLDQALAEDVLRDAKRFVERAQTYLQDGGLL